MTAKSPSASEPDASVITALNVGEAVNFILVVQHPGRVVEIARQTALFTALEIETVGPL